MTERQITFIDADENPLIVRLSHDRAQFFVVDSEPELEAEELRGFATALFAAYVAGPLARRLASAHDKIDRVREHLAATGAADELIAALDGSVAAIDDVRDAITATGATRSPAGELGMYGEAPVISAVTVSGRRRKPTRGKRVGECDGQLGWGWVRGDADPDSSSVAA
jgi:hypothetical protein